MQFKAYHNDRAIKEALLAQLAAHREADEIIQGTGWENGKGCAIGCSIHAYDHAEYEDRLGIPQMLARLEDQIFEGLPNDRAILWPERFSMAIRVGADLKRCGWIFLRRNLEFLAEKNPSVADAIRQCADALAPLARGESVDKSAARSAVLAAESAARSAERDAARDAARSAAESAASAAWSAARDAARDADYIRMSDLLIEIVEAEGDR